jgi:PAS domain S-box-containing protein
VILITGMRFAIERKHLQVSKDCLQSTLDAARLGSWRYDARHRVCSWDPRSKEIFGGALDPAQPERSQTQFRLRRQDGKVRWVETQGLAHLEGARRERQVVSLIGTVQDITARKSAEEAQARLGAIVTSSADAIVGKTLDGIVTNWNEAAERMFGYSADEMIGQSIRRVVPSDRQAEEDMILSRMAQSETIERHEMMLLAKDGRTFDVSITISPVRDAEGRNIGCSKIIRDITARRRVEEQVRLLMREANHRAKNILSIVQAIARQTAPREPEDFLGRFTQRLRCFPPIRTCWSGTSGMGSMWRIWCAPARALCGPCRVSDRYARPETAS